MPLNVTPRQYRIWICRPGQDEATGFELTSFCSGSESGFAQISVAPFDESGLIRVTGQVELAVPPNDLRFEPEDNPDWAVGNVVLFKVADSSGTLRLLPVSRLYLLQQPLPPYDGNWTLRLEVGDKFTLLDQMRPRPAAGGVAVSTGPAPDTISGSRTTVINDLLTGTGLTLGTGLMGPNLRDYTKDRRSPLVGQVGELALGGFASLYLDSADVIRPVWIGTTPERRLFRHRIGVDCAGDWEPLQSPIRPANSVEVVAPENATEITEAEANDPTDPRNNPDWDESENSERQKYSGMTRAETRLSRSAIVEDGGAEEIVAVVRTETWSWAGPRYQSEVGELRARGLTVPEDLYEFLESQGRSIVYPSPFTQVPALLSFETREYEAGPEGRLLRTEKQTIRTEGEVLAEFYKKNLQPTSLLPSLLGPVEEREITTYRYQTSSGKDSKGQVREIKTTIYRPKGQVAANANNWIVQGVAGPTIQPGVTAPVVAEVRVQRWRKRSSLEWEQQTLEYRAGQVRSGTIKAFTALRLVNGETISSRNGDLQPPAADRRPATESDNPRKLPRSYQIRNRVSFGNDDNPRDRVIEINHVPTAEAARTLAELLGKMDFLRQRGFRLVTELRDEWFSWHPLCRIDVQRGSLIYWGVVDAVTFSFSATQRIVVVDLMRAGRWPATDSAYPFAPLPPLTPTTDPTPLYGQPLPDASNSQPFVPVVSPVVPLEASAQDGATLLVLDWALGNSEGPNFTSSAEDGGTVQEIVFDDPLDFNWELDTTDWIDNVGNRNLTAVGTPPIVGGTTDGWTEFYWFDGGGLRQLGQLESGNFRWTRTESADWSWRIEFEILWLDVANIDKEFSVEVLNEFDLYVKPDELTLNIRNSEFDFIGDIGVNTLTLGSSVASNTWNQIVGEFNADTGEISASFNSTNSTPTTLIAPLTDVTPSAFKLGAQLGIRANVRIRNIKFFRTALIPR